MHSEQTEAGNGSALIGMMFAAKNQAAVPPEQIDPTDLRVCVSTSYHRRRVGRRPGCRRQSGTSGLGRVFGTRGPRCED
jgi:hypothetical protein